MASATTIDPPLATPPRAQLGCGALARGFTLIELIAVIVIIGVLAVFAIPRLNPAGFERYAFRHELLTALRYAQKTAMASGCDVEVRLNAGTDRYSLWYRTGGLATTCGPSTNGFGTAVPDPAGGGQYEGHAESGADLQSGGSVIFSGFGEYAGTLPPPTITLAGGPPIQIDSVTGYVRDQ